MGYNNHNLLTVQEEITLNGSQLAKFVFIVVPFVVRTMSCQDFHKKPLQTL